jgi:hypothetical protein
MEVPKSLEYARVIRLFNLCWRRWSPAHFTNSKRVREAIPVTGLGGLWGWDVDDSALCRQRLTDGREVISRTHRRSFTPQQKCLPLILSARKRQPYLPVMKWKSRGNNVFGLCTLRRRAFISKRTLSVPMEVQPRYQFASLIAIRIKLRLDWIGSRMGPWAVWTGRLDTRALLQVAVKTIQGQKNNDVTQINILQWLSSR